jgi:hypothetical protein
MKSNIAINYDFVRATLSLTTLAVFQSGNRWMFSNDGEVIAFRSLGPRLFSHGSESGHCISSCRLPSSTEALLLLVQIFTSLFSPLNLMRGGFSLQMPLSKVLLLAHTAPASCAFPYLRFHTELPRVTAPLHLAPPGMFSVFCHSISPWL